jgi:hypothetical protein
VPSTLQALLVTLLAILPGAMYTWAFERIAGRWGIGLTDRLYRFIGISAVVQALLAPVSYHVWDTYFRAGADRGDDLSIWLWPLAIAYVLIPAGIGTWVASAFNKKEKWAEVLVGPTPAPTAWDALFSGNPKDIYVLMRLKCGTWVGGQYADGSYVGGYPEPADIYLINELRVDQEKADFDLDENGEPRPLGNYGLLVRWAEVDYLEVSD